MIRQTRTPTGIKSHRFAVQWRKNGVYLSLAAFIALVLLRDYNEGLELVLFGTTCGALVFVYCGERLKRALLESEDFEERDFTLIPWSLKS